MDPCSLECIPAFRRHPNHEDHLTPEAEAEVGAAAGAAAAAAGAAAAAAAEVEVVAPHSGVVVEVCFLPWFWPPVSSEYRLEFGCRQPDF